MKDLTSLYDQMDKTSARHARAALEWMLPEDGGLSDLSQSAVQQFLWYFLPAKWLIDTSEHHEVAWALGDALAAAGEDRYAAICRDPSTHKVIDAYQGSTQRGIEAYRKALLDSGVEPPDTGVLQWGSVMGIEESGVREDVSAMLEAAIVSGDLAVGSRGWKAQAAQLTAAHLSVASARHGGRTPLEVVHAERAESWARSGGPARQRLYQQVEPLLESEQLLAEGELAESLAPARALLEGVGEGVTLTQAGYLPKALAVELNDRFGWYDLPGYKVNSEADVIPLMDLHEVLRKARLLTKRGRKLTVSAEGRRCLADDERLFRLLAAQLLADEDFEADVTSLKACRLLAAPGETPEAELNDAVYEAVAERWRTTGGGVVPRNQLRYAGRWRWIAQTLGWLEEGGDWPARWIRLTATGRAGTVIGLRARAVGPRQGPF